MLFKTPERKNLRKSLEQDRDLAEREAFIAFKEKLREEKGIDLDAPSEQLICPKCKKTYDFGADCIDCNEPLVGMSSLELVENAPKPARDLGLISIIIPTVIFIIMSGFFIYWLSNGTLTISLW